MRKKIFHILVLYLICGGTVLAQKNNQMIATITATANVIGNVDLIVMKDLEFVVGSLIASNLVVDPQKDPHAGQIKIVGYPNSLVRVTNEKQSILHHDNGQSQLFFTYVISGGTDNVQRKSILLTQNNEVRLSDDGLFFLWVGGELTGLENIIPGNYSMEVKIDVEYIS